ncbi:MAG: hypothetical protein IPM96_19670 [Ignavibacteria bacterium]|nr:hypothetical protein [Ignavibacteria bacterium]
MYTIYELFADSYSTYATFSQLKDNVFFTNNNYFSIEIICFVTSETHFQAASCLLTTAESL